MKMIISKQDKVKRFVLLQHNAQIPDEEYQKSLQKGKIAKNHSSEDEAILFSSPRFFTFFFLHHFMHF
jgi:hypothetical protein